MCKSIQVPRTGVQEGVGGAGGRGENDGIDNGGKSGDLSAIDGNDPWRGSGTGLVVLDGADKLVVIVRNEDANCESTEDVKEQDLRTVSISDSVK